jgi:Protein of unknown function (DUF3489)
VLASGAPLALRDPAPPAFGLLRGFGGAAGWAALKPKEIPMRRAATKRTAARSAASSRKRPKAKKAGKKGARISVRPGTKQSAAIDMLRSPGGATITALTKATGWQSHSVRGFLAGVVKKRLKLKLESAVVESVRIYRITGGHGAAPVGTKPDGRKS